MCPRADPLLTSSCCPLRAPPSAGSRPPPSPSSSSSPPDIDRTSSGLSAVSSRRLRVVAPDHVTLSAGGRLRSAGGDELVTKRVCSRYTSRACASFGLLKRVCVCV